MNFFLQKLAGLLYDVTVGLVKQYKRTSIDLAKIEIASVYLKVVKAIRQECLTSVWVLFGTIVFINLLGVLEMALLLYAPWPLATRVLAALGLGIVGAFIPLLAVLRFFSEERWMHVTRADELLAKAIGKDKSEE